MSSPILRPALAVAAALGLAAAPSAQTSYAAPADADAPGVIVVRSVVAPSAAVDDTDPGGRSQPLPAASELDLTASDQDAHAEFGAWHAPAPASYPGPLADGRDGAAPAVRVALTYEGPLADGRSEAGPMAVRSRSDAYTGPLDDGRPDGARPAAVDTDEPLQPVRPAPVASAEATVVLDVIRPNPVRDRAEVSVDIPAHAAVSVTVYDVRGRVVEVLFDGVAEPGPRAFEFDARAVATGTYVAVLSIDGQRMSQTFQVVR